MMLRKLIVFFCLILILITAFYGRKPLQVAAQEKVFYNVEETATIPTMTYEGVTYPDWDNLSFSSIPSSTGEGHFDLSEMADENGLNYEDLVIQLGYDPSRSWEVGTPIEYLLKLGDLKTNSTLKDWTISNVSSYTGVDSNLLKLADFGLLQRESLEDLVEAVPLLGDYSLGDVKPFYDLVETKFGTKKAVQLANTDLSSLSDNLEIGTLKLEELDLTQYDLTSIPNLERAKFGDFLNWEESFLSEIPGLADVPVASFLLDLVQGGFLAKLDVVWGEKEANRTNTISGSYKEGFSVPCHQENCAHIELTDALPSPTKPLHGKQWISGKSQQVKGGSGLLGSLFGGFEPTGRHPFGDTFKVVLTDTNESTGTASFSIYFRVCGSVFFGPKTCSPYIIGPFPWFSHKEKDLVFVGVDGVEASVPDYLPPVPSQGSIPSEIADQLPSGFEGEGYSPDLDGFNFGDGDEDDCNTYKGVSIGALRGAIANQESRGSGDYKAVGIWVQVAEGGRINRGRALGKYQFMSYREDIEAVFFPKKGGRELLKRIEKNTISVAEIKSVILDYFPPETQEKLRVNWFRQLIDLGYRQGLRGDALVRQIGAWHNGGIDNPQYGYGSKTVKEYKKELPKTQQKCQQKPTSSGTLKCSGTYIQPTKGTFKSGYGRRWGRMHNGIDVANAIGTPLVAIDGGTIEKIYNGCPTIGKLGSDCGTPGFRGYGNIVLLKLCNGWKVLYAHAQKGSIKFKPGQKVDKGKVIANMGSSGSSTGPHIHFEIRTNNGTTPENPLKYIPKY